MRPGKGGTIMRGVSKRIWRAAAIGLMFGAAERLAEAGVVITPTFDASITSDPNAANIIATINQAISTYEKTFSNPITVTIKYQTMNSGLGHSDTTIYPIDYATFFNKLSARASSGDDRTSLASLGGPKANNPVTNTSLINLKTANLKALGFDPASFPATFSQGFDGVISLNTHITDIGSPGTTGQFSLLATVEHEMDEVLGLGSALPTPFSNAPSPEDLFRYSSAGIRSFSIALSPQPYLSFDGGATQLVQYNTNPGGDYGDYNGVGGPRVQDAFQTPGASRIGGRTEGPRRHRL